MEAWYSQWYPDPLGLLVLGAAALYWRGLRKWKHRSRPHHRWQVVSFYAGILALLAAYVSPIDAISERLFWMHQVQHVLIRMIGPMLIMLGAPITPWLRGMPASTRLGVVSPLVRNRLVRDAYIRLTNPLAAAALFIGSLIVWQIPAPHDLSVRNDLVHYLMHFTMFGAAAIFWWVIIDPKPRRSRAHYGLRVFLLGAMVIPNSILSAAITMSDSIFYGSYGGPTRLWQFNPIVDQRWGGVIMWLPVDMMLLVAALIVFAMWYQRELAQSPRQSRASVRRPESRR